MNKKSPTRELCENTALMISWCPSWWEICELDPELPDTEKQKLSLERISVMNLDYFLMINSAEEQRPTGTRKRLTREDWINRRPWACVMLSPMSYDGHVVSRGFVKISGLLLVTFEANCLKNDGRQLPDGYVPSEESAQWWEDSIENLKNELLEIVSCCRKPITEQNPNPEPYPGSRPDVLRIRVDQPATFTTADESQIYGNHFFAAITLDTRGER